MATFRVHFASGAKLDVTAENPADVAKLPAVRAGGPITKIKLVKGEG
jgi:hypothetical protein